MTGGRRAGAGVRLPANTPREIRDFVSGATSIVDIDTSSMDWLPRPLGVPPRTEPSVRVQPGSTPTSMTVHVSWGRFGLGRSAFTIGIIGGTLRIASSDLPPAAARALSDWVASFNEALREDDVQLESLLVRDRLIRVTARPSVPLARTNAAVAGPAVLAGMAAMHPPAGPVMPPWRYRSQVTKTISIVAVVLLFCGGAVVVAATFIDGSDDDDDAAPMATDLPSSTDATTTTSVTTTTETTTTSTGGPPTSTDCPSDPTQPVAACPPVTSPPPDQLSSTIPESSISSTSPPTPTLVVVNVYLSVVPPDKRVECGESDIRVDTNGDGRADGCEVSGVDPAPNAAPAAGIPATGADTDVALHVGIALILVGLMAMVVAHRRAVDDV